MVLVGRHCYKAGLGEDEGAEVSVRVQLTVLTWIHIHHMEPWLITVHGVQDHLGNIIEDGWWRWTEMVEMLKVHLAPKDKTSVGCWPPCL